MIEVSGPTPEEAVDYRIAKARRARLDAAKERTIISEAAHLEWRDKTTGDVFEILGFHLIGAGYHEEVAQVRYRRIAGVGYSPVAGEQRIELAMSIDEWVERTEPVYKAEVYVAVEGR